MKLFVLFFKLINLRIFTFFKKVRLFFDSNIQSSWLCLENFKHLSGSIASLTLLIIYTWIVKNKEEESIFSIKIKSTEVQLL